MMDIKNKSLLCQQYLAQLYHDLPVTCETSQTKLVTDTYGEIEYSGVAKLLAGFPLGKQDHFVDLGSGKGKLVTQALLTTAVQKVTGIEIMPALHAHAVLAKEKMQQDFPEVFYSNRELNLIQGDFFKESFSDATVALLGSPCFSPAFMLRMGEMMNAMHYLKRVFTLRPISNLQHLSFYRAIRVECSWDTALCYVYQRN